MNKIKEVFKNYGFTESETKVTIFLIIVIIAGSVFKFLSISPNEENFSAFNYSVQDSLFYASDKNDKDSTEIKYNVEKNVASEQELLDFTDNNFSKRDNKLPELYEKSVDINTADKNTLILLPSIGEKTADKIIEYRKTNGNFKTIEEIQNVKGIGPAKFEKIKKYIVIK